jgi:biotin-(acetyl-CoA carboxylase) ligase
MKRNRTLQKMLEDYRPDLGDGNEYMAQAIDIDDGGHLVVLTGSGEKRILSSGEVKITL